MNTLRIGLSIVAILAVTLVWSQPSSPPATPIDGGLSLLLAAGGIYGLKKLRDYRNKG